MDAELDDHSDEIEQVRNKLEEDPRNVGLNRRLLVLLATEDRSGEALLYGLRGAELPAHNRIYGRSLVRLLINLGLPRLGAMIVQDPAHANAMDEIAFVMVVRSLRRGAHEKMRSSVLNEGLKRFPNSVELKRLVQA